MLHRYMVVGLGVALLLLVWQVLQKRQSHSIRLFAGLALLAYLGQAAVGAMFVWSAAAPALGAAHVGLAAATWALLVGLSVMEYVGHQAAARVDIG
jgi:heme A synthase